MCVQIRLVEVILNIGMWAIKLKVILCTIHFFHKNNMTVYEKQKKSHLK